MSPDADGTVTKLYKLKDDGSNWAVYRDRTMDLLKGKGLRSHLNGRVTKPVEPMEIWDAGTKKTRWFRSDDPNFETPLSIAEVNVLEEAAAEYDKREGIGSDIINNSIPSSVYREIYKHSTLHAKWEALSEMFEHRGNTVQLDILAKLSSAKYTSGSMRNHLSQLTQWRNDLLDNDYDLSDSQFTTYIISSLAGQADYRMFISAIEGAAEIVGKPLSSDVLKRRLITEHESRNSINSNSATASGTTALAVPGTEKAKGKEKKARKKKSEYHCTVCDANGHTKERCYAEGGGRHDQAPEWYKKKHADRFAPEAKSANVASSSSSSTSSYTCVVEGVTLSFGSNALSASKVPESYQGTILDCGASDHFTPFRSDLTDFVELHEHTRVADNRATYVMGRGTMKVELPMGKGQSPTTLTLTNVYCVPSFVFTLISIPRMDLAGYSVLQKGGMSVVRAPDDTVIGRVPLLRGLYRVTDPTGGAGASTPLRANASVSMTLMEFHVAMGHRSFRDLKKMIEVGMFEGVRITDVSGTPPTCRVCVEAKAIRKPFKDSTSPHPTAYADEVSSDVWGPASHESLGRRSRYFVLFIDRYSHETRVYFLRNKSDTFDAYQKYESWVRVQREARVKVLRSDRGGEYLGAEFTTHLERNGTVRKLTTHDSPQSNGIAERAMGVHVSTARALLLQAHLPPSLWAEAIRFSIWLHNRQFTNAIPTLKTPFEVVTGKRPNFTKIRPWGSTVLVKNLNAGKLESRVREGRYLGPDEESAGYRIYWEDRRTITVEREVFFDVKDAREVSVEGEKGNDDEDAFVFISTGSSTTRDYPPIHFPQEDDDEPGEYAEDSQVPPSDIPIVQEPVHHQTDSNILSSEDGNGNGQDSGGGVGEEVDDDEMVEKELLGGEEEEDDEPAVDDPVMPGSLDTSGPIRPRRNVAPPPGFFKEKNVELRSMGKKVDYKKNSSLSALVSEIDEMIGQEGVSVAHVPGVAEALASALAAQQQDRTGDNPTFEEAMKGDEKEKWIEAIREEIAQIEKMNTYEVVEVDMNEIPNIIGSRFVLRRKRDAQGNVVRYKARFVGKGYSQRPGIDFEDTFSPSLRAETLRFILSLGASLDSSIEQADAKNAYLNGILPPNEIIHMYLPPILLELHPELIPRLNKAKAAGKKLVLRLWRPLYGTKQGGNKWYEELCFVLKRIGFTRSSADHSLFYRHSKTGDYCLLGVATDDFTYVADSTSTIKKVKGEMGEHMELAEMGELKWILGVDVRRDRQARTISLSQSAYIDHILQLFGMSDCKNASTPLEPGIDLTPGSEHVSPNRLTPKKKSEYRELIGLLMYLSTMTRGDLAQALSVLARYLEDPHTTHMEAAHHVLRYVKATRDFRLTLGGKDFVLSGYSDANWGSELHRHSVSGYVFSTGVGAISWSSKKQPIITLSSTESEYVALTHAAKETKWLRTLCREVLPVVGLGSYVDKFRPTVLYCDNQGAIKLSTNPVFHARTKHIDIHFHFIRQIITSRDIRLVYCPTDEMVADTMTKPLGRVKFVKFRKMMGIVGPDEVIDTDAHIEGEC
ncbi:hypothetical protein MD484_g1572, partial [Candolleomyces efflorescens]